MSLHAGVALAGKNSQNAVVIVKLFFTITKYTITYKTQVSDLEFKPFEHTL